MKMINKDTIIDLSWNFSSGIIKQIFLWLLTLHCIYFYFNKNKNSFKCKIKKESHLAGWAFGFFLEMSLKKTQSPQASSQECSRLDARLQFWAENVLSGGCPLKPHLENTRKELSAGITLTLGPQPGGIWKATRRGKGCLRSSLLEHAHHPRLSTRILCIHASLARD